MRLTPEEEKAVSGILGDDIAYIQSFFKIPAKAKGAPRVPFNLWPVQRKLLDNAGMRNVVVKDSQIGCTSAITALFMKLTMTTPDTTSVIVAHEEFLAQRLINRAQVFYDTTPKALKPAQDHKSASEKRFPDINSVMYIGTARAQVFGRGEPIHNILFSEEAFYPQDAYQKIVLPSLQRVPPNGLVFRESTPNGESGSFYNEVQKALLGESSFKLQTLWWWENPDNQLEPMDEVLIGFTEDQTELAYTQEEKVLADTHSLTENQIRWRRWKIRELGPMFWQEHLESLDTCFLSVGAPYYDPQVSILASRKCHPAPHSGPGHAQVWELPVVEGSYIMGTDPGQGITTESVTHVWRVDQDHPVHCATISGLYEPKPMADHSDHLGRWYNNALWVIEANAHGLALTGKAVDLRYPRLYYRRDNVSKEVGRKIGWLTTPRTKPQMMQELQDRLWQLECYDSRFWRQVRAWRDVGSGKVEISTLDDHHDAACLVFMGMMGHDPNKARGFQGSTGWKW